MANLLVVDSDVASAGLLGELLTSLGHVVRGVTTSAAAIRALEADHYDLAFVELKLPDANGIELLRNVGERWPGLPVIMVAANTTVSEAIHSMRSGADDFVVKPIVAEEIQFVTAKALAGAALSSTKPPIALRHDSGLIGQTQAMQQVREMIGRVATSMATVLIRGESGTGKEVVARAIHAQS